MSKQAWYILIALCAIADLLIIFLVSTPPEYFFTLKLMSIIFIVLTVAWLSATFVAFRLNSWFKHMVQTIKLPWKNYKYYHFSSMMFKKRIRKMLENELSFDTDSHINRLSKIELNQIEKKFIAWLIGELEYNLGKITFVQIRDYLFWGLIVTSAVFIIASLLVIHFLH